MMVNFNILRDHIYGQVKNAYSNYDDEFIQKNYKGKIKSFKFPRGSLIIYNTYF